MTGSVCVIFLVKQSVQKKNLFSLTVFEEIEETVYTNDSATDYIFRFSEKHHTGSKKCFFTFIYFLSLVLYNLWFTTNKKHENKYNNCNKIFELPKISNQKSNREETYTSEAWIKYVLKEMQSIDDLFKAVSIGYYWRWLEKLPRNRNLNQFMKLSLFITAPN